MGLNAPNFQRLRTVHYPESCVYNSSYSRRFQSRKAASKVAPVHLHRFLLSASALKHEKKDFRSIQLPTTLYSSLVDSLYLNAFGYLLVHTSIMDLPTLAMYDESVTFIQDRLPDQLRRPQVAIICGSGLGLLAETVEHNDKLSMSFDYASVPHFPRSTGMTPYPRSTLFAPRPTRYLVLSPCKASNAQGRSK
jgi:hypothetical protein